MMIRTFILLPLLFLLAGCGRGYELVGRVVLLAASVSTITEVVGNSIPRIGKPIAGAKVTLFHELSRGNTPVRDSVWHTSVVTDPDGRFELSDYATPGEENLVGLEVSAPGYETVFTTYVDYMRPDAQYFLVILRKSPN